MKVKIETGISTKSGKALNIVTVQEPGIPMASTCLNGIQNKPHAAALKNKAMLRLFVVKYLCIYFFLFLLLLNLNFLPLPFLSFLFLGFDLMSFSEFEISSTSSIGDKPSLIFLI